MSKDDNASRQLTHLDITVLRLGFKVGAFDVERLSSLLRPSIAPPASKVERLPSLPLSPILRPAFGAPATDVGALSLLPLPPILLTQPITTAPSPEIPGARSRGLSSKASMALRRSSRELSSQLSLIQTLLGQCFWDVAAEGTETGA